MLKNETEMIESCGIILDGIEYTLMKMLNRCEGMEEKDRIVSQEKSE